MYVRIYHSFTHLSFIGNMNSGDEDFEGHNEEIHSARINEGNNFQGIRSGKNANVSSSSSSSQQIGGRHNGNHIYFILFYVCIMRACLYVLMSQCMYALMIHR